MAPYKRLVKKYARKAGRVVKKRYTTKTGGFKVNQLVKDVYRIKRSLNVEHKHIDFTFGSNVGSTGQRPTEDTPILIPLSTPVRGTSYNNRVGNQIRIVHITSKLEFTFQNNSDLFSQTTARAQILFAKSADDIPTIDKLYELDPNGHYTPLSMANTQEWNKYTWIKGASHLVKNKDAFNRYPPSEPTGTTSLGGGTPTWNATDIAAQPMNIVRKYSSKKCQASIRVSFAKDSELVEQMKPYLLLRSDVRENNGNFNDPVVVSGTIRFTYVDN
jgi:hypothetical protein